MQGKKVSVLMESNKKGWTETYLPVILSEKAQQGEIKTLTIKGYTEDGLVG